MALRAPEAHDVTRPALGCSDGAWLLAELLRYLAARRAHVNVELVEEGSITGLLERFDGERMLDITVESGPFRWRRRLELSEVAKVTLR